MDEPSSHLDNENQFKIFELIYKLSKETGKTFVIASHQVELLLQNASRLWWMDNGNFFAGFPEEVALRQEIFEKLSQNQIKFDYLEGHFKFFHPKNKSLYLANVGSALAYWTIHALERNGFEISKKSADYLQIQNGRLVMDNRIFNSIEELIHFLNGV
jgi:iron complex transport system ATP-binding protein